MFAIVCVWREVHIFSAPICICIVGGKLWKRWNMRDYYLSTSTLTSTFEYVIVVKEY